MGIDLSEKTKTEYKLKKPKLYKVILLNDDYTSMEFVVDVIMTVFNKKEEEAARIMLDVHKKGKGIVGVYPYDIAETKVIQVEEMAELNGYPLKAVIEEE